MEHEGAFADLRFEILDTATIESSIDIDKISEVAKEIPKKITSASLLDPQLFTSYSTRAPPII